MFAPSSPTDSGSAAEDKLRIARSGVHPRVERSHDVHRGDTRNVRGGIGFELATPTREAVGELLRVGTSGGSRRETGGVRRLPSRTRSDC
jgi:putative component of toxin-antitoxin plasmid stabilization module